MIDFLRGKLVTKETSFVIIDVGGVGYKVLISLSTFSEIKDSENITLLTYLNIKEDSHTLYGFVRESEKQMFLDLISVNGVGPATGLMIQSSLSASEIRNAILQGDVNRIKGVKGIGAKTAQRLILELKDKVTRSGDNTEEIIPNAYNTLKNEALNALVTLGINRSAADKSVSSIMKDNESLTLEEIIRQALKNR